MEPQDHKGGAGTANARELSKLMISINLEQTH